MLELIKRKTHYIVENHWLYDSTEIWFMDAIPKINKLKQFHSPAATIRLLLPIIISLFMSVCCIK